MIVLKGIGGSNHGGGDQRIFPCMSEPSYVTRTGNTFWSDSQVLSVQKSLSGSGRTERLRLMGKFISHRLVARPELDNTF